MATLKSYPAVYAQSSYEESEVKDLVFFVWSWDQRAAIVNIFELAKIYQITVSSNAKLESVRAGLEISEQDT